MQRVKELVRLDHYEDPQMVLLQTSWGQKSPAFRRSGDLWPQNPGSETLIAP